LCPSLAEKKLARHAANVATACYGKNDCAYHPYENSIGDAYRQSSTGIVASFKARGVRVVQDLPGCVGKRDWWQNPQQR
jgi:hypothetical protein